MRSLMLLFALLLTGTSSALQAQSDDYKPGLIGRYQDQVGETSSRIDPQIAFRWAEQPAERGLKPGAIQVAWRGYLMSQNNGTYQIAAYVRGNIKVQLNGKVILAGKRKTAGWIESAPLPLEFDFHPLQIEFSGTQPGAQVAFFWSGPNFEREPIPPKHLHHDADKTLPDDMERGEAMVRALRCAACHDINGEPSRLAAPALANIKTSVHAAWLLSHLQKNERTPSRNMPYYDLSLKQAQQLTAYLHSLPATKKKARSKSGKRSAQSKRTAKKSNGKSKRPQPSARAGRQLFVSVGCLACHSLDGLGSTDLFGGGAVDSVARKRPPAFFEQWLAHPDDINAQHRMPVFELTNIERQSLAMFMKSLGKPTAPVTIPDSNDDVRAGKQLFERLRCGSCHDAKAEPQAKLRLELSNSPAGCLEAPETAKNRPGYRLSKEETRVVRSFLRRLQSAPNVTRSLSSRQLLRENNCLSCHSSHRSAGLSRLMRDVAGRFPELAPQVPAMTPPSLISVGDKLYEKALAAMIVRSEKGYRPWLMVRMPRFRLNDQAVGRLVDHFITTDRVPDYGRKPTNITERHSARSLDFAGRRLVTTDGFGCTSCHRVGDVEPPKAPLNARGPTLSMMSKRIRRSWYDRWVRNPARIVPRMEMPSVQIAVRGVLDDNLNDQLAAVWRTLNQPGFQPPTPGAVRTVRHSGLRLSDQPVFLTDVLRIGKQVLVKPFVVALPNRHNIVLDLASGRFVRWTMGDAADQRTEGKTWFWTLAGNTLAQASQTSPDLVMMLGGKSYSPIVYGQFVTEFDGVERRSGLLTMNYRLRFNVANQSNLVTIRVQETFEAPDANRPLGFLRAVQIDGAPTGAKFSLRTDYLGPTGKTAREHNGRMLLDDERSLVRSARRGDTIRNGRIDLRIDQDTHTAMLLYETEEPVDRFPPKITKSPQPPIVDLKVVPGFRATRLPLAADIMPTALAWRPQGDLVLASLKGRVWLIRDTNADGLEDKLTLFSDELAAPFGLVAKRDYVDVVNKYSLLRLRDSNGDGRADHYRTVSSGWGHTTDYHDWAVGIPQDAAGNYYLALSCQQDKRNAAAAKLRGEVLKLTPRRPTDDNPHEFTTVRVSAGHRFPVGIARSANGDLFVTDNQGNYNPFNELNHVQRGKRFGFINTIDRKPSFRPPLTPPAINIPHPWTRSVNGICFLDTPAKIRQSKGKLFGPFEGHLVGCEYDTRRLIRMSLQKVNGHFQGAAYPFSYDKPVDGEPLLGPLTCAVSPSGDLYVGCIRDSGWGGANNIGSLVRLRMQGDKMPAGIAEVRAVSEGFEIEFTGNVVAAKLASLDNYSVSSYRRISTPAYGGGDHDRRVEKLAKVQVTGPRTVRLLLAELREGFVYEFRLKNLGSGDRFYPAEAYYTLRRAVK